MTGINGVMSIGANGLSGATAGTNIASQNISNAATPGYTRRTATLEAIPLDQGGGVRVLPATREQDTYLEKRGLGAQAQSGDADAQVQTLAVTDTVFGTGDGSVGDALDAFESSLSDLASSPSSTAVRQVVLSNADSLSQAFHSASDALTGARSDANSRIQGDISTLDTKVQQIGDLTGQIIKIKSVGGDAGDLEDKRDGLIRDISSIAPITTVAKDNGAVTVMLAGQRNLVDENGA
ncbi:MAG TPA: hypothetical protein VHZ95_09655, partial [Polyangiales bacterium]|nr:hypothetical protein [Polyangiales bacterium]